MLARTTARQSRHRGTRRYSLMSFTRTDMVSMGSLVVPHLRQDTVNLRCAAPAISAAVASGLERPYPPRRLRVADARSSWAEADSSSAAALVVRAALPAPW